MSITKSNFCPHGLLKISPLLPSSLLISHPSTSPILLNVPPSMLRYTNQHRIKKIFSIEKVLFSSLEMSSISGFCGWMLTRMDVKKAQGKTEDCIEVYGPKGLHNLMNSYGHILKRDMLRMVVIEQGVNQQGVQEEKHEDQERNHEENQERNHEENQKRNQGVGKYVEQNVRQESKHAINQGVHQDWGLVFEDEVMSIRGISFYDTRDKKKRSLESQKRYIEQIGQIEQMRQNTQNEKITNWNIGSENNESGIYEHLNHPYHDSNSDATDNELPSKKRRRLQDSPYQFPSWKVIKKEYLEHLQNGEHLDVNQARNPLDIQQNGFHDPAIMHYALHVKDLRGKFLPNEAKRLGLKPGPQFGELSKGNIVTLENGVQIHPDQVHTPAQKGVVILIIYGTEDFHNIIIEHQNKFQDYMNLGITQASFVFHLVPNSTWKNDEYQNFVGKFNPDCYHVVCNEETLHRYDIFEGSSLLQEKLSFIDENIFKSTKKTIYPKDEILEEETINNIKSLYWNKHKIPAQHGLQLVVHPHEKIQIEKNSRTPQTYTSPDEELIKLIEIYKNSKMNEKWDSSNIQETILQNLSNNDAEITFLGTGSAIPSKYRNVTGIFLNLFESGSMFMDCGEGTFGQLCRVYGKDEADLLLEKIKLIHISHIHADHHLGLLEILERRSYISNKKSLSLEPIVIIGPSQIFRFLNDIENSSHYRNFNYIFINCTNLLPNEKGFFVNEYLKKACDSLGIEKIYNILVDHSCAAYAVILKHKKGWKIIFSGDTRPCNELVKHGKDTTLLIHEATHDDELLHEALARKHSTTSEAISIAEEMGAYRTILTHFSQRYPKFPKLHENVEDHVGIAFDLCKINLKDLKTFPKALPAMKKLFEETMMEDDDELPDVDNL